MRVVPKRRRRESRTDYGARLVMLKSSLPRIVVRKTNKHIIISAVESSEAQDKVISGTTSRVLLENGWDRKYAGSLKSVPAAYLTGLLFAKKAGNGKFILDMGMARNVKGSRLFAAAKGLVDGGMQISVGESVLPTEARILGEHLKPEVKQMIAKVRSKLE